MNQCDDFRGDLDAYRDQSLDRRRSEQIEAHLSQCSDCRKQIDHDAMIEAELKSLASSWVARCFGRPVVANQRQCGQ